LHDHQTNPHVHISVRAESMSGRRLNPRKADLQRWRETFAEKLRGYGVEAEATRQATRGRNMSHPDLWQLKANEGGRLRKTRPSTTSGDKARNSRVEALRGWLHIGRALAGSPDTKDVKLAGSIAVFIQESTSSWNVRRTAHEIGKESHHLGPTVDSQIRR
jgi:hypothetical protein